MFRRRRGGAIAHETIGRLKGSIKSSAVRGEGTTWVGRWSPDGGVAVREATREPWMRENKKQSCTSIAKDRVHVHRNGSVVGTESFREDGCAGSCSVAVMLLLTTAAGL